MCRKARGARRNPESSALNDSATMFIVENERLNDGATVGDSSIVASMAGAPESEEKERESVRQCVRVVSGTSDCIVAASASKG